MSRVIKFRAWHTRLNCYLSDERAPWHFYGPNIVEGILRSDNCIIEQFTGLLDKNGKEIYEGDILEVVELHDGHDQYWNQPTGPAIRFAINWDNEYVMFNVPYDSHNFQVCGNIHESPEVVK